MPKVRSHANISINRSVIRNPINLTSMVNITIYGSDIGKNVTINSGVDITDCTIGANSVIGKYATLEGVKIGRYCTVAKGVSLMDTSFSIPDRSYIESDSCKLGTRNGITLIYTPKGLWVKPGCREVEPVEATLTRLRMPHQIDEWLEHGYDKEECEALAKGIIKWLNRALRYTVE